MGLVKMNSMYTWMRWNSKIEVGYACFSLIFDQFSLLKSRIIRLKPYKLGVTDDILRD